MQCERALVPVAVNVQERKDGKAKAYQIEQLRAALQQYRGEDINGSVQGQIALSPG